MDMTASRIIREAGIEVIRDLGKAQGLVSKAQGQLVVYHATPEVLEMFKQAHDVLNRLALEILHMD